MRGTRSRTVTAGLLALGAAAGLTLTTTASAAVRPAANGDLPGGSQACAGGQPKLDYGYGGNSRADGVRPDVGPLWGNVCGTGTWNWGPVDIDVIRMPTSPHHRVWLHQNANGTGWAVCFYSTGNDVYIPPGNQYPGNIQVSTNTSSC